MRLIAAVAFTAVVVPDVAAAGRPETPGSEQRICTQVAVARAGSRMGPRRICRTAAQWREALGADWRQHLAGARSIELDYEALMIRSQRTEDRRSAGPG